MIPKEAAKIVGCHYRHIRRLCQQGKIKHRKIAAPVASGFVYDIDLAEVKRVRDTLPGKGVRSQL